MNNTKIIALLIAILGTMLFLKNYLKEAESWESLNQSGVKAFKESRYTEAEKYFVRAADLAEKFSQEDLRINFSLNQLAEIYRIQSKYNDAEQVLKRLLNIYKQKLGTEHINVALTLNNLAVNFRMQKKYEEAETVLKEAIKILEKSLGPNHSLVSGLLAHYSYLLDTMGRKTEAESIAKRMNEIDSKTQAEKVKSTSTN
jgi:tetratricopeptide (TPR) repeat protein